MAQWKFMGSTALVALVAGNMALAEVTPEQVWQNWQDMAASYGETITADSAARDGDTLLVSGMTASYEKDGASFSATIDEVSFTDAGDGSVEITMSDSYPVDLKFQPKDATTDPTEVSLTVTQPGLTMTASGTAEETRYDIVAPTVKVALDQVQGVNADKVDLTAEFGLTALEGNYIVTGSTDRALSSTLSAKMVNVNIAAADPATNGKFNLTMMMDDLASTSNAKLIAKMDPANMAAALNAGFATDSTLTYGKMDYSFDFADATQTMASTGSFGSGNLAVAMDKTRLSYGAGSKNVEVKVSGSSIPFPEVVVKYAESAFNMLMPVSKSDAPVDFSLLTKLADLTVSDEVWAMFDPNKTLPRDPVTVVLDAKGTGKLNLDLFDPAAMAAMGSAPPGELNTLNLTDLTVKLAGAAVTGSGALTFDNTDLVTFNGVPTPTGKVDLKVVGANGLMDKLVTMGLMPADQVQGFRMMMGMFAKMVEGETDTMTSTLEFKDKGFFANGMQLK